MEQGKKDNFYGDRSVVMSAKHIKHIKSDLLIKELYISDIGFYPCARNHYRKREKGISENILIYCIDGSGSVKIEQKVYELRPNSYFVIPAHIPHVYRASESEPWSIYWIHFGGEKSDYFSEYFSRVIPIGQFKCSRIEDRINLFNEILKALESGFSKENIYYANLCLNHLLASFFYIDTYRAIKGYLSTDPVDQAIFFMQSNLYKSLKLSDISGQVKLSESHLSKTFRNRTGTSPINYFINLRMQEAIRLMGNHSLRIKEIALKLGYDDPYYFSRLFTKHIGVSPLSFIKTSKIS